MTVRGAILPVVLMLLSVPCLLQGQETSPVQRGKRVRVSFQASDTGDQIDATGRLIGFSPDLLYVAEEGSRESLSVPRAGLRILEVQSGTRRAIIPGVLIGGFGGAALFSILSLAIPSCTPETEHEGLWAFGPICVDGRRMVHSGAVLGVVIGAIAGGRHKTPRWAEVPLESIGVFVAPGGRTGFGLSLPLGR